jgi:hypothetical protein
MRQPSHAVAQHLGRLKILCGAILAGVVIFAAVVLVRFLFPDLS